MAQRNHLQFVDLEYGQVYPGGNQLATEPISNLLGVGNMGGIRPRVDQLGNLMLVVLYSTADRPEWPDEFDPATGALTYFGDNRTPGKGLLESPGNRVLDRIAQLDLDTREGRLQCPPFLMFKLARGKEARTVTFEGLAVPGSPQVLGSRWCTARYFGQHNLRFMNFELKLTVLDDRVIRRSWMDGLASGQKTAADGPAAFREWLEKGVYRSIVPEGRRSSN